MSVISLHLGQAGVQLGDMCWLQYTAEHGLEPNGVVDTERLHKSHSTMTLRSDTSLKSLTRRWGDLADHDQRAGEGFNCFFQELGDGRFAPLALFVDTEASVIDMVKSGPLKNLYRPSTMVAGKEDAANNFARGRYSYNKTLHKDVMNELRKMIETCDRLQGLMVYNSVGGGTGSGYHSLLLQDTKVELPKSTVLATSIYPSPRMSTAVVEPYNAVLNTNATLEHTDCVFLSDNEAMYNICVNKLGADNPRYTDLNSLLATTVSSITASLRFKGSLNADFNDFQTNLVPYPRIHFSVMSYAPIVSGKKATHESLSVTDLSLQVFNQQHRLSTCDSEQGRYMACCLLYRGDVTPKDVNSAISQIKSKGAVRFVPWCPTGIKVGLNTKTAEQLPGGMIESCGKSVCMVANTTSVQKSWESLNKKFDVMFSKKAFVHWYTGEGMEEPQFLEAQENILALENDYDELN